jgi:uncharacterized coiled-coil DUF342 family protein
VENSIREISKKSVTKKSFIISNIHDLTTTLQNEYSLIISRKEDEIQELKNKETELLKDFKHILNLKNDLLKSIEIETSNHQKTLETLKWFENQTTELEKKVDKLMETLEQDRNKCQETVFNLLKKIETFQEDINQVASKNNELIELRDKIARLKTYIEKGGGAYNHNNTQPTESQKILQTIKDLVSSSKRVEIK